MGERAGTFSFIAPADMRKRIADESRARGVSAGGYVRWVLLAEWRRIDAEAGPSGHVSEYGQPGDGRLV